MEAAASGGVARDGGARERARSAVSQATGHGRAMEASRGKGGRELGVR